MSLKFEVDSLENVPVEVQSFYTEHDGKYRLAVEGIDPADELKEALRKEREVAKTTKQKLREIQEQTEREKQELETKQANAEKQRMLEKEEFKSLYESELNKAKSYEDQISQLKNEFEGYKQTINQKTIQAEITSVASQESAGGSTTELLAEQMIKYAKIDDGKVVYEMGGIEVSKAQVIEQLKTKYPTLFKGSGANGSGATGSNSGGRGASATKGDFGGSRSEREAAIAAKFALNN